MIKTVMVNLMIHTLTSAHIHLEINHPVPDSNVTKIWNLIYEQQWSHSLVDDKSANNTEIYPLYNYPYRAREFKNRNIVQNISVRTSEEISGVKAHYKDFNQIIDKHLIKIEIH